jgi:predicted ATPase
MLKKLELENFKAWRAVTLDFAPLTAFFGANSSGKSSLLQFLLLLKQTRESDDRSVALDFGSPQSLVDLGSFKDAVYLHNYETSISWQLTWEMDEELHVLLMPLEIDSNTPIGQHTDRDIAVSSRVSVRDNIAVGSELSYTFGGVRFSLEHKKSTKDDFCLEVNGSKHFKFENRQGADFIMPGPMRSYAFPDQIKTYFTNAQFLSDFEIGYIDQMNNLFHLGPLRVNPRREYIWSGGSQPRDVGRSGERAIEAILSATARGGKPPFQRIIASWLKTLGLIERFQIKEIAEGSGIYRALVQRDALSPETFLTDVGFGVSQILPVIVLLEYAPEGSTVMLEQPEIHLHPAVQSALADLIISAIKHRKLQIILESHSEHLLRRLLRRIAEKAEGLRAEDVALYFCKSENGISRAEKLSVNQTGHIENWPDDFFGNSLEDTFALEEAAIKQRTDG